MPVLLVCLACTAKYAVGLASCPHCGSTELAEEGAEAMPKITAHGGPSNAADYPPHDPPTTPVVDGAPDPEPEAPTPPAADADGEAEDGEGTDATPAPQPARGRKRAASD